MFRHRRRQANLLGLRFCLLPAVVELSKCLRVDLFLLSLELQRKKRFLKATFTAESELALLGGAAHCPTEAAGGASTHSPGGRSGETLASPAPDLGRARLPSPAGLWDSDGCVTYARSSYRLRTQVGAPDKDAHSWWQPPGATRGASSWAMLGDAYHWAKTRLKPVISILWLHEQIPLLFVTKMTLTEAVTLPNSQYLWAPEVHRHQVRDPALLR